MHGTTHFLLHRSSTNVRMTFYWISAIFKYKIKLSQLNLSNDFKYFKLCANWSFKIMIFLKNGYDKVSGERSFPVYTLNEGRPSDQRLHLCTYRLFWLSSWIIIIIFFLSPAFIIDFFYLRTFPTLWIMRPTGVSSS